MRSSHPVLRGNVLRAVAICTGLAAMVASFADAPARAVTAGPAVHSVAAAPGRTAAAADTPISVTYPGGDLVASVDDGGVDPALASKALSTYLPQALGLPAGTSLGDLIPRTYNADKDQPALPAVSPPPAFAGGSLTVSGSTITVDIPAASLQTVSTAAAEPPNGIITGYQNKCLHVASSADNTPVDIQDCDGTQSQHFWMMTDGTIQIFEKCLTTTGNGDGAGIVLLACNGSASQQWQQNNSNGTLKNPASGRCLDDPAFSTTNGTQLDLWDCNGGANQKWNWPGKPPQGLVPDWAAAILAAAIGGLAGAAAYIGCLAFFTVGTAGTFSPFALTLCAGIWTFAWTAVFGLMGRVFNGTPIDGTYVRNLMISAVVAGLLSALGAYYNVPLFTTFPLWIRRIAIATPGALLRFAKWVGSGLATAYNATVAGFSYITSNVMAALRSAMRSRGIDVPQATGPITSAIAGKCADYQSAGGAGPGANGTAVVLTDCTGQNWTVWPKGQIALNGACLTVHGNGTAVGTLVELYECDGGAGQDWTHVGSALVNSNSNLCLDDPNASTTNGTQLRVWTCNGSPAQQWTLPGQASVTSKFPLRVLPFGDSITSGVRSTDGSGYRCDLQSILAAQGDTYQFVGSLTAGTNCSQPQNEGHSGWTIGNLQSIEGCTIKYYEPNLVLLDIGTNDVNTNTGGVAGGNPTIAANAIENLIGSIRNDDPGVTILVGGLIPTPIASVAANMTSFNTQVATWISQQAGAGAHLMFVSMAGVTTDLLADELHPNDQGYQVMANAWGSAIDSAVADGWINAANAQGTTPCSGNGTGPINVPPEPIWSGAGEIAPGVQGGSPPIWSSYGQIAPGVQGSGYVPPSDGDIEFAPLTGTGRGDYIWIRPDSNGTALAWQNAGGGPGGFSWNYLGSVSPGVGCPVSSTRYADLTGSGRADYLCVAPNGSTEYWYNAGLNSSGHLNLIPEGYGFPGPAGVAGPDVSGSFQFADMTGSGRADALLVRPDSSVLMWKNAGVNGIYPTWIYQGEIAPGIQGSGYAGQGDIDFAPIFGSGRADYIWVRPDSSVLAWYNGGPNAPGGNFNWIPMGEIAPGVQGSGWTDAIGQHIRFADMTGSGRADYLFVRPDSSVLMWRNLAGPGLDETGPPPDGQVQFAPVFGDGRADYLDVLPDSSVLAWQNAGPGAGAYNWNYRGVIAPGVQGSGYTGPGSGSIQFADMTGSGRADYLWVKPDSSVLMWANAGVGANGSVTWLPVGEVAVGVQGSGWAGPSSGNIQFADMNGDGRADYLWVRPDSSVLMWENPGINTASPGLVNWISEGEVAVGVQASGWTDSPGQFIEFADVFGTGRADYLFVRPDSSVLAWYNPGVANGIDWVSMGDIAPGVQASGWQTGSPGNSIQFAPVAGDGAADYLWVQPNGGVAMWQNIAKAPAPSS